MFFCLRLLGYRKVFVYNRRFACHAVDDTAKQNSGHLLEENSAEAVYEDSLLADLLEEDLAVNLHDEGKAGWWGWKKSPPPPPPPPPPKCTNIAQHSKAHLQKAIRVAAACYSKQNFKDVVNRYVSRFLLAKILDRDTILPAI